MSKKKAVDPQDGWFDLTVVKTVLERLPDILVRLAEEENIDRFKKIKASAGIVRKELEETAYTAAEVIADVLGIPAEFQRARSVLPIESRAMKAKAMLAEEGFLTIPRVESGEMIAVQTDVTPIDDAEIEEVV